MPIGVAGELYIGGVRRGAGLSEPAGADGGALRGRSVRAEPRGADVQDGRSGRGGARTATIEYLGRNDHQVKIRGFRIELGEIEAQLLRHAQVKEAVVLAREDVPGEKRLVAYVTCAASRSGSSSAEELRAHLKAALPEYMVPSAFVLLERCR